MVTEWGYYFVLHEDKNFKVKKVVVNPGQRISLQYHNKRSESWVIIDGEGLVTIGENKEHCFCTDHFYIYQKIKHRIENLSEDKPLIFVEIQTGEYFGEDDIVRIEDDYHRI